MPDDEQESLKGGGKYYGVIKDFCGDIERQQLDLADKLDGGGLELAVADLTWRK